jgi:hypothetical protein
VTDLELEQLLECLHVELLESSRLSTRERLRGKSAQGTTGPELQDLLQHRHRRIAGARCEGLASPAKTAFEAGSVKLIVRDHQEIAHR